ncbi:hypothetical protein Pla175_12940 [Pirellulimonas nuda]|uniref:Uncharacterized protein n=1 Tax=Pirellulimonas nuda TaxID=2528009 RepID=A0A518D8Y0_9BACT|nr:hypothetical protein [Pirellulimonas nuda]QDU87927.1 hypothetical protein Pla175_12940 [Pirellulimonas nuda]
MSKAKNKTKVERQRKIRQKRKEYRDGGAGKTWRTVLSLLGRARQPFAFGRKWRVDRPHADAISFGGDDREIACAEWVTGRKKSPLESACDYFDGFCSNDLYPWRHPFRGLSIRYVAWGATGCLATLGLVAAPILYRIWLDEQWGSLKSAIAVVGIIVALQVTQRAAKRLQQPAKLEKLKSKSGREQKYGLTSCIGQLEKLYQLREDASNNSGYSSFIEKAALWMRPILFGTRFAR